MKLENFQRVKEIVLEIQNLDFAIAEIRASREVRIINGVSDVVHIVDVGTGFAKLSKLAADYIEGVEDFLVENRTNLNAELLNL